MKVGIQYGSEKVSYKNCPSGRTPSSPSSRATAPTPSPSARNISGTTYRVVTSKKVNAKIENAYAPYLIATTDVQFTSGDDVCKKAAELCKDAKTDMGQGHRDLQLHRRSLHLRHQARERHHLRKVSKYIPDTAATLNSNKGICYDLASLFAAMCRSQNIPCTLTKGYAGSSYHAWNKVNISGNWYQIDMTYAVTKRVINETTFAGCVSPLTYSQQSDTLAVSAVA